jgi:glycosyltransferase involved in cell wall biosynthesis
VRILHIIDELKVGGAQTHLETMIRCARESHPDVSHRVVSLFGGGPIGERLAAAGVPVEDLGLLTLVRAHRYAAAVGRLESVIDEHAPDVVEAHLTWSRLLGLFAAWRRGVKLRIGYEQGDIFMTAPHIRLANFVLQHCAHRLVVCSAALGRWARRTHGISEGRLLVLHNPVDTRRFVPLVGPKTERFGFSPGTFLMVSVGTLGRGVNKRVDVCIQALALARKDANVGLVICGDGPQRAELEALASRLGVTDAVRFLGLRQDVAELLGHCDVYCHAAPFEPFGIVCVEAMATGLPTIVPNGGGIPEAVEDGKTGFIYPVADAGALAARVVELARSPERAAEMGVLARRAAVERFDAHRYVVDLYATYASLLSGTRTAA